MTGRFKDIFTGLNIFRWIYMSDLCFSWMYQIPYFRKEMAMTVSGLKSGMFSQMKYEDIVSPRSISNSMIESTDLKIE